MSNVVKLRKFTEFGPKLRDERRRLAVMFRAYSVNDMRRFWDEVGEDSFYHGDEGDFDCADIHGYMNMIGDGSYCAV